MTDIFVNSMVVALTCDQLCGYNSYMQVILSLIHSKSLQMNKRFHGLSGKGKS